MKCDDLLKPLREDFDDTEENFTRDVSLGVDQRAQN